MEIDELWNAIQNEARAHADAEPVLASFFHAAILSHSKFESSLSYLLAQKISNQEVDVLLVRDIVEAELRRDPHIGYAARKDITASFGTNSACREYCLLLLYSKGFHAVQCHRVAHALWNQGRIDLAYFLQSQSSRVFSVDIHPAAQIGCGVRLNHATGIVIGETAVVEDEVSIHESVTLGATGKVQDDRHPKVRRAATIGAGAEVLGNIEIREGAIIGAGSVVLKTVEPFSTVVGVPGTIVSQSCAHRLLRPIHMVLQSNDIVGDQQKKQVEAYPHLLTEL